MRFEPILIALILLHQFAMLVTLDWTLSELGATQRQMYMAALEGALSNEAARYWTVSISVLSVAYLVYAIRLLMGSVTGLSFLLLNLGLVVSIGAAGLAMDREVTETLGYVARYSNTIAFGGCLALAYSKGVLGRAGTLINAVSILFYCYYFSFHAREILDQDLIGDERINLGGVGATTFAAMVDSLLLFSLFCRAADKQHFAKLGRRLLLWLSVTLGLVLVGVTASRGSLLALCVYAVVYFYVSSDRQRRRVIAGLTVTLSVGLLSGILLLRDNPLVRRPGEDLTTGRWDIWSDAVAAWLARPSSFFFGLIEADGLHNSLVGMAATYGFIALVFYLAVQAMYFACAVQASRRTIRSEAAAVLGLLASIFVLGMFENVVYLNISPASYLYYALGCFCVCLYPPRTPMQARWNWATHG